MHRSLAVLAVAVGSLAFAGTANADYYIGKRQAQINARDAAETRYAGNGVTAKAASCRPQWATRADSGYIYHRWVCAWVGYDADGDDVHGFFRITGQSDDTFGYMPLYGGLRWD
jgi:hypothetical protein